MTTLFAWVTPAYDEDSPVDHTWVTTYDNRKNTYPNINDVEDAGELYWYCWGSFHPKGGAPGHADGYLAQQSGNLDIAKCLVLPNASCHDNSAARGTIFRYGLDGVCHQLANQVLYSTAGGGHNALTVKGARGYQISTFLYGTYGTQHTAWQSKLHHCAGVEAFAARPGEAKSMMQLPDDFEDHVRETLADKPEMISKLLELRTEVHNYLMQPTPEKSMPTAEFLNARNQYLLEQAATLLGPEDFKKVFGIEAGTKINLVDPTVEQ